MSLSPDELRFLERQNAASVKYDFPSISNLTLAWHVPPAVNGRPLKLSDHGSALLLLLAARARRSPGAFVSTPDLLQEIMLHRRLLGELNLSWEMPIAAQIHSAVADLRGAIGGETLGPLVVQSMPRRGYRLAIPDFNIVADPRSAAILDRFSHGEGHSQNGTVPLGRLRPVTAP
jgi:DNA-binding winged helix-turn-helix (wHTH) protein